MSELDDLALLSATELRARVASREIKASEIVESCLRRIERLNGTINAVCTISERALDDARAADERVVRGDPGLLLGLPVGIKDITATAGLRTTYGSLLYRDHVPEEDALVVRRLKEAGAIVVGKTNTPEFAAGGNTFNAVFGPTRNPWNPALSGGGSTGGGGAALATGMIALAEGTDLGGSLRIPASFCGVVGLRPSPGLVPTHPSDHPWDTLDVTGPMARTAGDVALALQTMAGPSPLSPFRQPTAGRDFVAAVRSGPRRGVRLAYCPDLAGIGVDPEIEGLCRRAAFDLAHDGAVVEEIDLDLSFARSTFLALRGYRMVAHHVHRLDRLDEMGDNLAGNLRAGLALNTEQLGRAEQERCRLWHHLRELLARHDHLLTPCMVIPPFPVEQSHPTEIAGRRMKTYVDWIAPTFVLSLSSLPVASVPVGLDSRGLPVGLQVAGPPEGEETVLALAQRIQDTHPIGLPPSGGSTR